MAKHKPPKNIKDRREELRSGLLHKAGVTETRTAAQLIVKALKILAGLLTLLATILGVVTGYLSLIPRISAVQNQPLNVNDPFSTPFVLSNDGPLGLNKLEFSCLIVDAKGRGAEISNINASMGLEAERMEPGERVTIPCSPAPTALGVPLEYGDVALTVTFRPDFVFSRKPRLFRFTTLLSSDGHLYWYPQPMTGAPSRK